MAIARRIKLILVSGLALVLVFSGVFAVLPLIVKAADPTAVSGKAKILNTGEYLYFDSGTYNSNVTVSDPNPGDANRRTLAGYAWSPDFGWFNFGDAVHGGPVRVTYATGDLTGQAYALNTGGFIDFDSYNSNAYIDTTTGEFKGYGWSNDGGWVNFEDTGCRVEEEGKPNNPATTRGYNSAAKTTEYTSSGWEFANGPTGPYFEWSGATDTAGTSGYASGIAGYWVYFGTDPTAEPTTVGAYQTAANYTNTALLATGQSYYLRIRAKDEIGNLFTSADTSEYTEFIYRYDPTAPAAPEYINISPAGCSTQANFTFTWPAVVDPLSGTAGYQYKRGSTGTVEDLGNVLTTQITAYQEGDNVFYLRTVDNAGNTSVWQTAVYCSVGLAYIIDGPEVTVGSSSITVNWISDKETTGYVRVYDGNAYISEQGHTGFDRTHSVKVVGLEPEEEYRYKLVWLDESGNLGESNWFSITTAEAPQVYNLQIEVLSNSQALVSWTTTEGANCTIEYGLGNYDQSAAIEGLSTGFSYLLSGLSGGTTYQLRIQAVSSVDGAKFFGGRDFATPPLPSISGLLFESSVEKAAPSLKVSWKTNVATTSSVFYREKGTGSYKEISSSDKTSDHEITIDNLADSTIYEIYTAGIDQYGNEAKSDLNSFTTPLDTRPPKIFDIVIESSNVGVGREDESQIAVSWKTDEPATGYVEYAQGISGKSYTGKTSEDPLQSNSHLVIVSGLKDRTPYHLRVCSLDKGNNQSCSDDNTTIPGEAPKSILRIILDALRNTFGWLESWL